MVYKKSSSSKMMEEDLMPETEVSREFTNFLVDQLKDIYWTEKHLVKAYPKIQKATASAALKDIFAAHLPAAQLQVERIEQIFDLLGETIKAKKSEAVASLLDETNRIIEETPKGTPLRDTGLVFAVLKIKHYEIAAYSALLQLAKTMGNEDIISLIEETFTEKKDGDELLTSLSERNSDKAVFAGAMAKQPRNDVKAEAVYESVNLTGKSTKK